jgi:hypothetical protein
MKKYAIFGILLVLTLSMSLTVSAGNFRGHNHYGVRGQGHYSDGMIYGWTNSGNLISGSYSNGHFSGTVGNKFVIGNYYNRHYSGQAQGARNPYFHGRYWK